MSAENILGFIIFLFVALIMIGIGISQMKSKTPVGFIREKSLHMKKN